MTRDHKIKVIWIDFFGVICSEVAPFWFQKYFSKEESILLKEKYFKPADLGEISNSELMNHLSAQVQRPVEEINEEFNSYIEINNQVVSCLKKLKKSYKIILCSNASSDFLRKIIRDNSLDYLFDEIVISSDVKCRKPDIQFFEKCLASSDCSKEEIIFIDDNKMNVESAKGFGVQTILFTKSENLLQIS